MAGVLEQPSLRLLIVVSVVLHLLVLSGSPSLDSLNNPVIRPIPLINLRLGGLEVPRGDSGDAGAEALPSQQPQESKPVRSQPPKQPPASVPTPEDAGKELTRMLSQPSAKEAPKPVEAKPEPVPAPESRGGSRVIGSPEGKGEEAIARYGQLLAVWIQRFKVYPAGRNNLGQATVLIRITRSGEVILAEIAESSGSRAVDDAAVDMAWAASPVPPVPDWYDGEVFQFLLPVSFNKP